MAGYRLWCWTSEKWVCNENSIGEIYTEAHNKFSEGWEYWNYGTGGNADGDELNDAVCWYLVTDTLNRLGYHSAPQWDIWFGNSGIPGTPYIIKEIAILAGELRDKSQE
jgi:hypothetical protein